MKKFLKEVIFWEIITLIIVLLFASCVNSGFPIIVFLIISAVLTFMLEILVKKVFIYPLVIGGCYTLCGVMWLYDEFKNSILEQRRLKKENKKMKEFLYIEEEAERRANELLRKKKKAPIDWGNWV